MTGQVHGVEPLGLPAPPSASAPVPASPQFVMIDELAEILRYERKTLYRLAKNNELPGCRRLGGTYRIHLPTVLSWFASGPRTDRKRGRAR